LPIGLSIGDLRVGRVFRPGNRGPAGAIPAGFFHVRGEVAIDNPIANPQSTIQSQSTIDNPIINRQSVDRQSTIGNPNFNRQSPIANRAYRPGCSSMAEYRTPPAGRE
jgi:hypothetical protein